MPLNEETKPNNFIIITDCFTKTMGYFCDVMSQAGWHSLLMVSTPSWLVTQPRKYDLGLLDFFQTTKFRNFKNI